MAALQRLWRGVKASLLGDRARRSTPDIPCAFEGPLSDAKRCAQENAQFLVLCAYSRYHERTPDFLGVMSDNEVVAELLERAMICNICVDDEEGNQASIAHNIKTLPCIIVLFKDKVVLEYAGPTLGKDDLLREWNLSMKNWEAEMAVEVSQQADRRAVQQSVIDEEQRMQRLEAEDIERLRVLDEKRAQQAEVLRSSPFHDDTSFFGMRSSAETRPSDVVSEERKDVRVDNHDMVAAEKTDAIARLHDEPHEGEGIFCFRFRCATGELPPRRFRSSDRADMLLYYVKSLDVYCETSDVQLSTACPASRITWEEGQTLSDLKLATNTVINVRFRV